MPEACIYLVSDPRGRPLFAHTNLFNAGWEVRNKFARGCNHEEVQINSTKGIAYVQVLTL